MKAEEISLSAFIFLGVSSISMSACAADKLTEADACKAAGTYVRTHSGDFMLDASCHPFLNIEKCDGFLSDSAAGQAKIYVLSHYASCSNGQTAPRRDAFGFQHFDQGWFLKFIDERELVTPISVPSLNAQGVDKPSPEPQSTQGFTTERSLFKKFMDLVVGAPPSEVLISWFKCCVRTPFQKETISRLASTYSLKAAGDKAIQQLAQQLEASNKNRGGQSVRIDTKINELKGWSVDPKFDVNLICIDYTAHYSGDVQRDEQHYACQLSGDSSSFDSFINYMPIPTDIPFSGGDGPGLFFAHTGSGTYVLSDSTIEVDVGTPSLTMVVKPRSTERVGGETNLNNTFKATELSRHAKSMSGPVHWTLLVEPGA